MNSFPIPEVPSDFDERCECVLARLQSDEKMSVRNLADHLGLPFVFLSTAMAVYVAARESCLVAADSAPARILN